MTDDGWLVAAALAVSLAGHLVAVDVLGSQATAWQRGKQPIAVRFRVVERAQPPPPAAPEPPKPVEPKPRLPARTHETTRQPPPETPAPEAPETTGVTLTGEGASWSSVVGNGQASNAPLRVAPVRQVEKRASRTPMPEARPRLPETLPATSLSRRPMPPALDDALRRHYPAAARRRGLEGEAVVRVRIDADGRVRIASVVSETAAGFGEACRSTVVGSVWTAPLDRSGARVATHARYRCHFRVDD